MDGAGAPPSGAVATNLDDALRATEKHSPVDEDWWTRLAKVADGHETAEPSELREMLRSLVTQAEGKLVPKKVEIQRAVEETETAMAPVADARVSIGGGVLNTVPLTSSSGADAQPPASAANNSVLGNLGVFDFENRRNVQHSTSVAQSNAYANVAESKKAPSSSQGTFEREAHALSEELAQMQRTLKARMQRYQEISADATF